MKIPRKLRRAGRAARKQGWKIELTGNKHLRWIPPDRTRPMVITASTPGRGRAVANALARLQQSGLQL